MDLPYLHKKPIFWLTSLLLAISLQKISCSKAEAESANQFNQKMGSGINLGNALDAPKEGEWGVVLQADYFALIKSAGFSHVRVPIRWSAHAGSDAPYTIEPEFFQRVDWVVKQSRANGLKMVLNMHHYDEFENDPDAHSKRFLAMWHQIAEHFSGEGDDVSFEPYNEPSQKIDAPRWNSIFAQVLQIMRATNPGRAVVVGPVSWNDVNQLPTLELPEDKHLIVTFHYYSPHQFTHQGASWMGPDANKWLGTKWTGSAKEVEAISTDFDKAQNWGKLHDRPIYLGEFGAYEKADMDSRVRWIKEVRAQAKSRAFSDAYWEFCSGFGIYDADKKEWRGPLLDALRLPVQ